MQSHDGRSRWLAITPLLVLIAFAAPIAATQAARVDPEKIDEIFEFASSTTTPGCVVATVRNGAIEFARGYGMADVERGVRITPKTVFNLGSVSKQFTAAAINLLIADGKLSPTDDVKKYIPELPGYEAPITVNHLMHHTSGVREISALFNLAGRNLAEMSKAEALNMLARQRALNFRPGAEHSYANSNYALLALIVERVSGKTLREFTEERMFRPLGMTSTTFQDRKDMVIGNRALGYAQQDGKWRLFDYPTWVLGGAGGVFSSVEDLARWEGQMLVPQWGGPRWRELTATRGTLADGQTLQYGAGLVHSSFNGETTVQHSGGIPGYGSYLMRFPKSGLSIAVMCNGDLRAGMYARRVAALYVPAAAATLAPAPVVKLSAQEAATYTGVFFNRQMPFIRQVVAEDGKLVFIQGPNIRTELLPLGGSRFQLAGSALTATFTGPDTLKVDPVPDSPELTFVRGAPPRRELKDYTGTYASDELQSRWKLQLVKGTLTVMHPSGREIRLDPMFEDGFRGSALAVIALFVRDQTGQIVAMDISSQDWVRHVRFARQR